MSRTKTYYQKRIRELEDKYKFKVNMGAVEEGLSDLQEIPTKETGDRQETIDKLTHDRNLLAQKLMVSQ